MYLEKKEFKLNEIKMETLQKLQSLHIGQGQGAMHARSIGYCHEKKKKKNRRKK
jgi:hypothetical protein